MSETPIDTTYGKLEPVLKLKAHELLTTTDPTGRFVCYRQGLTVKVLDTAPDVPKEVASHKKATSTHRYTAVHPNGQQLVVRDAFNQQLEVRGANGKTQCKVTTDTSLTDWKGNPLATRSRPPQWGFGDEAVAFSEDGAYVLLATHLPDGQACVQLYDTVSLQVVDTLTDLRLYSYYATNGESEYAAMPNWSESWLVQEPRQPGLLLGVRNAGDSALGVFGIFERDGQLEQVEPAALSASVFKVDNYALRGVRLLPGGGMLVVDRDHHLGRVAWPPAAKPKVLAHRQMAAHLRNDDWDIQLPWDVPKNPDLMESEELTVTDDHILLNIDTADDWKTQAMVAFSPTTLEPLGLVKRPRSRLTFGAIEHLGGDLFGGSGSATTQLWRLRPS